MKFTAQMQHTKESIHQLSSVQYHTFRYVVRVFWSLCGVGCIWGAVATGDQFLFYILLFSGIWLLLNLELPAKHQADKIVKAGNGSLPHTHYRFGEDEIYISSKDYEKNLSYRQLYMLLEDSSYFYLFVNRNAGFMVDKKSILPAQPEELKIFLQEKSGLNFRKAAPVIRQLPSFFRKGGNKFGKS